MFKILLALHVLTAVFAIGPLVHAATTAGRGIRSSDAVATAASARLLRIYAYASVVVIVLGFGLMSSTSDYTHHRTAQFSETWIWLSVLLWAVAVGLVLGLLVPGLTRAGALIEAGDGTANPALARLTAPIAAAGGTVGLIFAAIVFLMVYRPGS